MKTISLDTHKVITLLEERGFTRKQAEGFVEAVKEIDASELVTVKDLDLALAKQKSDLQWSMFMMLSGQFALFVAVMALLLDIV